MEKKQWSEMSKNEKLDYLHERIQATDAEIPEYLARSVRQSCA
jgi:hypothetical protein